MGSHITGVPRLPWDAANPFPFYERRRREGDIVWDDTAQAWLVLGYHPARQVLAGPGWTIDLLAGPGAAAAGATVSTDFFNQSMLGTDGAPHQRLRRSAYEAFTPSHVNGLTEGVHAIADAVISGLPTETVFDFMDRVAHPVPLAVLAEWLGIDAQSSRLLSEHTPQAIPMLLPLATAEEFKTGAGALTKLAAHILPLAAHRRSNPDNDLLSFLASDPEILLDEAVVTAVTIAVAGFETIEDFLGAAAVRLLMPGGDGATGSRLVDDLDTSDPSLITELLRLDGPQSVVRTATEAQRIGDVDITPGQQAVVVLAAANRDPAVFDDPERFRLARPGPAPLTFGYGEHYCLGAALARLEADAVLHRMLARDPVLSEPVIWRETPARRGLLKVPMIFRAPPMRSYG